MMVEICLLTHFDPVWIIFSEETRRGADPKNLCNKCFIFMTDVILRSPISETLHAH